MHACVQHGIWFDPNELPQVLTWIKKGGLHESKRLATEEEQREAELARSRELSNRTTDLPSGRYDRDGIGEV
ncbi:MAG: hypothetical protein ACI9HK_000639, partial [Pirellulaceae bacterium]